MIRDADPEEIVPLAKIWYDGWRDAHAALLPEALARARTLASFEQRLASGISTVRVAGQPGHATGFCMTKHDELYQLYVHADARGTGAAAALLADGEARIATRDVVTAWLACAIGNHRAARFYEKHGWLRVGNMINELDTPDGIFPLEVWRYEKRLR